MGLPAMCTLVPDASVPIRLSGPSDFRWHIKYAAVSFQQRFLFCPLCLPEARSIQRTKANPYNILFEIVRIRLGFILLVFCVTRLTPPALLRRLSFALSSCTPSRTATPAKPFRGGLTRLPGGGAGRPNGLTEGVWFVEWLQLKITNVTPFAASRHETEV